MLEQVSIMGCIWHFGETQGLPLLWTSEEESVWKSYKNKKKDLARENKEESVLSQLYLSAVIKITAFPPNIHTLGFLWYLEGKAEIEWYLSKALSVITNHKRSLLLIIICWDILKCTVFCDRCHQQMEKRSWEALHIYTDFYHNIIIRAHVRWQLRAVATLETRKWIHLNFEGKSGGIKPN